MCFFPLAVSGNVKIWCRLTQVDADIMHYMLGDFEKHDTGMKVSEFRLQTPEIFADIYKTFEGSAFVSYFGGGSIAQLAVGDMVEAGQMENLPYLGMLLDFQILEQWIRHGAGPYVVVGHDRVIADMWQTTCLLAGHT